MAFRFASLGSGSRGNALVVENDGTIVLVDCGFGPRELARRLALLELSAGDIAAVLLTHEHSDHVAGAAAVARGSGASVYLTHGTAAAVAASFDSRVTTRLIDSHTTFRVGGLEVQPYPVPHDAREPVQFVFSDGARRLGILTDAGHVTPHITATLSGCDALLLECNHDVAMLESGRYPPRLKQRIRGRYGHLDNDAAGRLLGAIDTSRLRHLVAAHLSEENNTPALARAALASALACDPGWVDVASQGEGFAWREII